MTTIPTVGFNVETVTYKNVRFNVWVSSPHYPFQRTKELTFSRMLAVKIKSVHYGDIIIQGQKDWFSLWTQRTEIELTRQDRNYIGLSVTEKWEMHSCWYSPISKIFPVVTPLEYCPRLTLSAMSPAEITEKLQLHKLKDHLWFVHPSCATTAEGLFEGLVCTV